MAIIDWCTGNYAVRFTPRRRQWQEVPDKEDHAVAVALHAQLQPWGCAAHSEQLAMPINIRGNSTHGDVFCYMLSISALTSVSPGL